MVPPCDYNSMSTPPVIALSNATRMSTSSHPSDQVNDLSSAAALLYSLYYPNTLI